MPSETPNNPYDSAFDPASATASGTSASGNAAASFGSAAAATAEHEPVDRAAQVLVDQLLQNDYHPVILCGTSAAGKTTILASLCSFLERSGMATFDFGPWPADASTGSELARLKMAKDFFYERVQAFSRGEAPPSTGSALPYFVPLEIMPSRDSATLRDPADGSIRPVRLAVMDMGGELFKPAPSVGNIRRAMPRDVEQLLFQYSKGVSMLYLGPVTRKAGYQTGTESQLEPHQSDDWEKQIKEDPDAALINAMASYESKRPHRRQDRHLFVLSKWDLVRSLSSSAFMQPGQPNVESEILGRFPKSWARFKAMRVNPRAKWFVQYSAGVISDRTVSIFGAGVERDALDRYAMVMWNWLYAGATRSDTSPEGITLFPEVVPEPPRQVHPLMGWLAGRMRAAH